MLEGSGSESPDHRYFCFHCQKQVTIPLCQCSKHEDHKCPECNTLNWEALAVHKRTWLPCSSNPNCKNNFLSHKCL